MVLRLLSISIFCALLQLIPAVQAAENDEPFFPIKSFEISGNQFFTSEELQRIIQPYTGDNKTYADIQRAQRAIEARYQAAGLGAVLATTPEQELTDGIVRIQVHEAKIAKVSVLGNQFFGESNVRASIPQIKEGEIPNLREISENTQLANQNPAKRIEVILNSLPQEDSLEAKLLVNDEKPLRISTSLDNTGNQTTGRTRLGVAIQHANLFDRDQVGTLAYTTSPEKADKVDICRFAFKTDPLKLGICI